MMDSHILLAAAGCHRAAHSWHFLITASTPTYGQVIHAVLHQWKINLSQLKKLLGVL
jgi:hypothetical protein